MARSPESGKKGRGRGCAILIVIASLLLLVGALLIGRVWETKRTEQILNERYGEAVAFVPALDGSIAAERVEAFLRVRQRILEHCATIQDSFGVLARLDQMERGQGPSEPVSEREGLDDAKGLLGFGSAFLRFMDTRNQALLDEEMGLGEYSYIYVLAYAEQLRNVEGSPLAESEQASVGDRARSELTQILRNQLDAIETRGIQSVPTEISAGLRDQIAGLIAGRQKLPWENGLPPVIATSFEPYTESLPDTYCPGIAKIELSQKNKGLNVKN